MMLNTICYKQIKDTFWYGVIGNDFILVIDKSTGYFNATKLCEMCGKDFNQWKRLKRTQELIEYGKNRGGNDYIDIYEPKGLINFNEDDKQITGTYIPSELFLALAMWISNDFYAKCMRIIFGPK